MSEGRFIQFTKALVFISAFVFFTLTNPGTGFAQECPEGYNRVGGKWITVHNPDGTVEQRWVGGRCVGYPVLTLRMTATPLFNHPYPQHMNLDITVQNIGKGRSGHVPLDLRATFDRRVQSIPPLGSVPPLAPGARRSVRITIPWKDHDGQPGNWCAWSHAQGDGSMNCKWTDYRQEQTAFGGELAFVWGCTPGPCPL